ncbi:hypothetical protein AALO_G00109390 [Alosa alosa]|uniref:Uncharacterized protein n=1 Tax=Alosa alosa TaxID=278164 RepID=A0AAV6GNJ5_9TELE|nr:hypothetical protein AALO_G00109390 [Alosa alosa]
MVLTQINCRKLYECFGVLLLRRTMTSRNCLTKGYPNVGLKPEKTSVNNCHKTETCLQHIFGVVNLMMGHRYVSHA